MVGEQKRNAAMTEARLVKAPGAPRGGWQTWVAMTRFGECGTIMFSEPQLTGGAAWRSACKMIAAYPHGRCPLCSEPVSKGA